MGYITMLFQWMPPVIQVISIGIVSIFIILTVLKIVKIILDCIPFA